MPTVEEQLLGILRSSDDPGVDRTDEGENASVVEAGGGKEPVKGEPKKDPRPAFSPAAAFQRRDTHPLVLDVLLLSKYGPEWLAWEPETLWHEIEQDFRVTPSVYARNKINALKTTHVVDTPWTEWEVFNQVALALTDVIPDFRVLQKPSPAQVISAVEVMGKIRPLPFSEEVGRYVAACFLSESIYYLPPPVAFAQPYAEMPRYRCRRCGNVDTDTDNAVCDSCGAPQEMLERTKRYDPEAVEKRYTEVMKERSTSGDWSILQENVEDVQVAKLLQAKMRSQELSARLRSQMEAIR